MLRIHQSAPYFMLVEKILNFVEQIHKKRIVNYLKEKSIKVIIDVGTHKGEFINCFLEINSVKKIFAFEPQKKIFEFLKKNFLDNKKVHLNNIAIDINDGKKEIKINKMSLTSTLNDIDETSFYFKFKNFLMYEKNSVISQYEINTTSLDNFFLNESLKDNTLLKIDTEGYEFNVLNGAQKKISEIKYVLIENQFSKMYKNNDFKDCHNFLLEKNFELIKKFKFPLFYFEDRLYKNKSLSL